MCDPNPTWRPTQHHLSAPGTRLQFDFTAVLDYREQWAALEANPNPFAAVVMAHLKAQETRKAPIQRKEWKFQLVRHLHERGYNREEVINLFKFVDWIMTLPKRFDTEFWTELYTYEESRKMSYITSVERLGFERGQKEERRSLVLRLLTQKFGELPDSIHNRIIVPFPKTLEIFAIAGLSFASTDELSHWLDNYA